MRSFLVAAVLLLLNVFCALAQPNTVVIEVKPGVMEVPLPVKSFTLGFEADRGEEGLFVEGVRLQDASKGKMSADSFTEGITIQSEALRRLILQYQPVRIERVYDQRWYDPALSRLRKRETSLSEGRSRHHNIVMSDDVLIDELVERLREVSGVISSHRAPGPEDIHINNTVVVPPDDYRFSAGDR